VNDDRPWDRPGAVRRDCEPHRGPALRLLGGAGVGLVAAGPPRVKHSSERRALGPGGRAWR
jgi:hypothetical protein